jgi:hypothetical protein
MILKLGFHNAVDLRENVMLAEIFMLRLELAIRALDNQHISRAPNIAVEADEETWASLINRSFDLVEVPARRLSYQHARRPS